MKILITGASGFAGTHLIEYLQFLNQNYEIHGTYFSSPKYASKLLDRKNFHQLDLSSPADAHTLIAKLQPDLIFHLAAFSGVASSEKNPRRVINNNVFSQLDLLEAVKANSPDSKILIICSADEYGRPKTKTPINETARLYPLSPYAVSKISQDYLAFYYYLAHKLNIIRVRPFNFVGERQTLGFVIPDFASQIVKIEKGNQSPEIKVGDLSATRDFTDVKDMVKAFHLALTKGKPGQVYNLGSGRGVVIKDLLNQMIALSSQKIKIAQDPSRLRPADSPYLVCDATKFKKLGGWQAEIPLEQTLKRVLNYWRENV